MKKCSIIYNPASGQLKRQKILKKLIEYLEDNEYLVNLIHTERKGHATEIIESLSDETDLVICIGGDGTLNETITGNLNRQKRLLLAYLPFGSCNDVGTMYGYTKNSIRNIKLMLHGTAKNIDVCKINDHPFIYVACFGSFVNIPYTTPRKLKSKYGRLAYILYGLTQLNQPIHAYDLKFKLNGKVHEGKYSFIFITNSSRVAGMNNIYKDVKLDDNMFEVAFCKTTKPVELLGAIIQLLTTDLQKIPAVEFYRTNKLDITFKDVPPYSWCMDGEEYAHNKKKFTFTVTKEMQILMPSTKVRKLFKD